MKLGFGKLNKQAMLPKGSVNVIAILTPIPVVLQSGERVDLKTGLVAQVPEEYVLSVQTGPSPLMQRGLEILGPLLIFPGNREEIIIPLYNSSRSQIDLQPGMEVAVALIFKQELIEIEEFTPQKEKVQRRGRKSLSKDLFKFEIN